MSTGERCCACAGAPGRCSPASARRSTSSPTCRAWPPPPHGPSRELEGTSGEGARHAQDDPRAAGAGEGRGAGGGRPQPPRRAVRRDPDQGEPHRRGRRHRRGDRAGRGRPPRSWRGRSRSRSATPRRSSRRSPPGLRGCCWTTWTSTSCGRPSPRWRGRAELEASGGVTLATLRSVALTGVEWISLGALTHSAPALDLSMQLTALP